MKVIQQNLSNSNYTTTATLTGYIKEPDAHAHQATLPALIFVPGGSYTHIPEQQAESIALAFSASGYQVFILKYSFTGEKEPLLTAPLIELALSFQLIQSNSEEWFINQQKIATMGFSVGGHIVALFNDYWSSQWLNTLSHTNAEIIKPAAVILGYPVIDFNLGFPNDSKKIASWTNDTEEMAADHHVSETNVPTFVWVTADDPLVPSENALSYVNALSQNHVPYEYHVFAHGPHGLALADERTAWNPESDNSHVAHWFQLATEWLKTVL